MVETTLHAAQAEGIERRYGAWKVFWRPDDFLIPDVGYFNFKRVILPVEIVVTHIERGVGFVRLRLESGFRFALLHGAPLTELDDFKRRASAAVLAASGTSRFCADCARDAAARPHSWNGNLCPGCRDAFCRNPNCLRRLGVDDRRDGERICRHCDSREA